MSRPNEVVIQQIWISKESFISLNTMEIYVRKEEVKQISDSDIIAVGYDYDPPCVMIAIALKFNYFEQNSVKLLC